jgi:hypothetical protein
MLRNSWVASQLAASKDGLSSVNLVIYVGLDDVNYFQIHQKRASFSISAIESSIWITKYSGRLFFCWLVRQLVR